MGSRSFFVINREKSLTYNEKCAAAIGKEMPIAALVVRVCPTSDYEED